MPEGSGRRKEWAEPKFGEPQREKLRVVQAEVTNLEKPQKIDQETRSLETSPEVWSYTTGEELEMIADNGELETWKVASFNSDEDEVFLVRQQDNSKIPSLEVMNTTDLAIETASLPIVAAASEVWDDVLDNYADVLDTDESSQEFKLSIDAKKGRLLRQMAFEILRDHPEVEKSQNPENITRILNKVLSQHLMAEAKKIGEHDSRHREAENLEAVTEYYAAIGNLRDPDNEATLANASTELLKAKIAVTASDAEIEHELTAINARVYEGYDSLRQPEKAEPYAKAQEAAIEAWNSLKSKLRSAEQQLNYLPENSFKMLAISEDLAQAFAEANRADAVLNNARVRAGLEVGQISKDDYQFWMGTLKDWANKPGAVAAKAEQQSITRLAASASAKPNRREPVFVDKPNTRPPAAPKPSRFGKIFDKAVDWLGL